VTTDNFSRRQFLKLGGIGVLGAVSFPVLANAAQPLSLYVGTYTSGTSGSSEGIYLYGMDPMTGALTPRSSVKSDNPSFVVVNAGRFLYAVNEVGELNGKRTGGVSAFAIDASSGKLTFINQQPSEGADPCHLSFDRQRKHLFVANYTSGTVAVLPIQRDGSLGPAIDVEQHEGSGPREQQKGPHAHCIKLDRANRFAFAADLGSDKVMIYRFNNGKLDPGAQPSATLHPGAGPRHLTFHPNGKYLYVINELDSSLTTFKYDAAKGTLTAFETVSTLPRDFTGTSYCADVHVSKSGRFLYGSNRGHNSIVVFAINPQTARLSLVEHVSTEGNWPRNFAIDPTGRFLLVANQRSDNVVVFRIDAQTGRLTPTGSSAQIPVPVCLQFL
jgi:6-phosphogluconolactonase